MLVEGVVWGHMQDKEHMEAHSQSGDMGGTLGVCHLQTPHSALQCQLGRGPHQPRNLP